MIEVAVRTGVARRATLAAYAPALQAEWLLHRPAERHLRVEGTVASFDISGFTRMTERLARRGPVGAEEVTTIVDAVLVRLLSVVDEHGGDVLSFGGDALLVLFESPAKAAEAARVGLDVLTPFARTETPVGAIRVRVSIGAEHGLVDLFMVGEAHRQLLVAGPTVSAALALESAARPGTVRLGAQLRLAARADHPLRPRQSPEACAEEALAAVVRDHVLDGAESEHRIASVVFVERTGTDALAQRGDVDAFDALVRAGQAACDEQGITFLGADSGRDSVKLAFLAGAPGGREDHANRAVLAAKHVVDALGDVVRAGVHSGRIFVGAVGSARRRTWTAMGDVVNVSARVMSSAPAGGVLVTSEALDLMRTQSTAGDVRELAVKGRRAPVVVRRLGEVHGSAPSDAASTGIVGRGHEISVLTHALAAGGAAVEVVAPAGMGKTRLLDEVLAVSSRDPALRVDGAAYAQSSPYLALRAPLRRLLGVDPADETAASAALVGVVHERLPALAPWLPLLAETWRVSVPATPESDAVAVEFRPAAARLYAGQLVAALLDDDALLVMEDAHWLDAPSSELLGALITAAPDRGWTVLVTRRPGEEGLRVDAAWPGAVRLELGPLNAVEARALVRARTGDDAPLDLPRATTLLERGGGHPLYLVELAKALSEGRSGLPDSLEALLASSIDVLPAAERARLRRASVLGTRFRAQLLDALDPKGSGEGAASPARSGHLVDEGNGHLRFAHDLLRQAAYDALPFAARRRAHGKVADLLARATDLEDEERAHALATHHHLADNEEQTWLWSRAAAVDAGRRGASTEQLALLEQALAAAKALGDRPDAEVLQLQEEIGTAADRAGRYDRAVRAVRAARRGTTDVVDRARLGARLGQLAQVSGSIETGRRWYADAARQLEGLDDERARRVLLDLDLHLASTHLQRGNPRRALPLLRRADAAATHLDADRKRVRVLYLLNWALRDSGQIEAAAAAAAEAIALAEGVGAFAELGTALNNAGISAYYSGQWDESVALYERSAAARHRAGDVVEAAASANNIAEIRTDQGRVDEARVLLEEAYDIFRSAKYPLGIGFVQLNLARSHLRLRDTTEARTWMERARATLSRAGQRGTLLELELRESELLLLCGDPAAGGALAQAVADRGSEAGPFLRAPALRQVGVAHALQGADDAAAADLDASLDVATTAHLTFERALTLAAYASLVPGRAPADASHESSRLLKALGAVLPPSTPLRS